MGVWSIEVASGQWYGFPLLRSGYVKVADDPTREQIDPDVDRGGTPEFARRAMGFLRERVPDLGSGRLVAGRTSLYTNTPDDHFVIDWDPGSSSVLVAGYGTSHGFKFGSAIGSVIADALEDRDNPLGRLFRLGNRFAGTGWRHWTLVTKGSCIRRDSRNHGRHCGVCWALRQAQGEQGKGGGAPHCAARFPFRVSLSNHHC